MAFLLRKERGSPMGKPTTAKAKAAAGWAGRCALHSQLVILQSAAVLFHPGLQMQLKTSSLIATAAIGSLAVAKVRRSTALLG